MIYVLAMSVCPSVCGKTLLLSVQLQEVLLSYIANPQLELALVMLIVPFIVNVSGAPPLPVVAVGTFSYLP